MDSRKSLIIGVAMMSLVGLSGIGSILYGVLLPDPFDGRHPENLAVIRRGWTTNGLIGLMPSLIVMPVLAWRLGKSKRDGANSN